MIRSTPDFDQRIADWLEADPTGAPADVLSTVAAALPSIPQARRGLLAPWRITRMTNFTRAAAGIAAFAVVGLVAINVLGNGRWIGNPSSPSPSAKSSVTLPPASFEPLDTTDWVGFLSARHGYEARHPNPYDVTSAEAALTFEFLVSRSGEMFLSGDLRFVGGLFDPLFDTFSPAGLLYPVIGVASTRLPDGLSEDAWLAVYRDADSRERWAARRCVPPRDEWQPIIVDGVSGGLYDGCGSREVLVFVGGRAYTFTMTRGMGGAGGDEDLRLLLTFVSTVTLHPDQADDST